MQVNRNSSTLYSEHTAAVPAPSDSARDDRRAVKKIAISIDSGLRKLGRQGFFSTDVEKLTGIRDRVQASQVQLNALSNKGVDRHAPPQTGLRKARSAVLLGGSMVGRSGAIVGATVAGIVEAGAVAAAVPVVMKISSIQSGAMEGA